jgi:hypothetical protein
MMNANINERTIDLVVFICANLFNLFIICIMISRPFGLERLERVVGILNILLLIPLIIAVILNFASGRDWWTFVLPLVMIAFLILELLLDYVLKIPFRETRLLWPYLALFYLSAWMMIGYTFLVNRTFGFITLITYFLGLAATAYSYSQVGHG